MKSNTLVLDAFWISDKWFPSELSSDSREGKIFHTLCTGHNQHLGWMDLLLLKKIIKERHISHIILKNMDILGKIADSVHVVQVCTAYCYKRHLIIPVIQKDTNLKKCKPLYTTAVFGGWNLSEDDEDIPERAKHYMKYLLIRTQVESIACQTNKVKVTAHFNSDGHVIFDTEPTP